MNSNILLIPPVAFAVYLLVMWSLDRLTGAMASKEVKTPGKELPYACGENFPSEKLEPDYGDFFPFAIFFTLLHVAALMLATLAIAPPGVFYALGAVYISTVGVTLVILFI